MGLCGIMWVSTGFHETGVFTVFFGSLWDSTGPYETVLVSVELRLSMAGSMEATLADFLSSWQVEDCTFFCNRLCGWNRPGNENKGKKGNMTLFHFHLEPLSSRTKKREKQRGTLCSISVSTSTGLLFQEF